MPGILFLGSLLLIYLIMGGSIKYVDYVFKKEQYLFFIAILITSPILGLIISTIGLGILHVFCGYSFYLSNPSIKTKWVILRQNDPMKSIPETQKLNRSQLKEYFYKHQAFIREKFDTETLRFLERRWNFLWIHLNNSTAILLSIILSFFLDYSGDKNTLKMGMLISIASFLLFYLIFAIYRIISLRKEVINIEEEAIIRKYNS